METDPIEISSSEQLDELPDELSNERPNKELALKILTEKNALVFEGGGVLGVAHAGALLRLYELGGLNTLTNVVGTSVGSLVSMGLACGATPYYIKSVIFGMNLERFKDGGCILTQLFRFIFKYGLHKGDVIEEFAGEVLKELTGNSDITFKEAYERFGTHLTITYLSTRQEKTMYADHITEPDLMIKTAARWSSTIPLFYKGARRYRYISKWRRELMDIIVDGGVGDNYPIHVLREQNCNSKYILGFKLFNDGEPNQYNGEITTEVFDKGNVKHVVGYGWRIVDFLRAQALRYHVHKEDWKLTCKINVGNFQTTDFEISESDKIWLYNSGREAMDKHLLEIEKLLDKGKYPL